MTLPASLDPDLLRTFVYIAEEGNFTRAGQRVGRTQSAVSMQLQRLETLLGQTLVSRGRGGAIHLTPHGEFLLERSRELLALNDQIWASFRSPAVHGTVRLGSPDDYALRYLPTILKRFAETHPSVQVDVLCLPSSGLVERLREGELDLTLCSEGMEPHGWPAAALWRAPLSWITSTRYAPHRQDPLPVALAAEHCNWRSAAVRALGGDAVVRILAGRGDRPLRRRLGRLGADPVVLLEQAHGETFASVAAVSSSAPVIAPTSFSTVVSGPALNSANR